MMVSAWVQLHKILSHLFEEQQGLALTLCRAARVAVHLVINYNLLHMYRFL
jgi:hypothetical protein